MPPQLDPDLEPARPVGLDGRLDSWSVLAWWQHATALALLALVAVVRWHHCVLLGEALIDEVTYLAAFRAFSTGVSPYDVETYHYTPLFARAGAAAMAAFGESGVLALLRSASIAGLAGAVWISSAWLAMPFAIRLTAAVAFVALAPAAGAGLCTGNVSFAVIGVILLALVGWSKSLAGGAVPSGLALGATVAAKPLAPLALVALLCHRPKDQSRRRRQAARLAGAVGGLTALALLAPSLSRLAVMSAQPVHPLSFARSFSLRRILSLAGFEVGALAIVVVGALAVAILVRRRPLDRSRLLAVATVASVLATPIIWNHTLLLTLPVQVMALAIASSRRREAMLTGSAGRARPFELILVILGALAIQISEGFGAVDELSRGAQLAFLMVPYSAPALLASYVLGSTGAARSERSA